MCTNSNCGQVKATYIASCVKFTSWNCGWVWLVSRYRSEQYSVAIPQNSVRRLNTDISVNPCMGEHADTFKALMDRRLFFMNLWGKKTKQRERVRLSLCTVTVTGSHHTQVHTNTQTQQKHCRAKKDWEERRVERREIIIISFNVCVCVSDRHKVWACLCKVAFTSVEVVFSGGGGVKTGLYTRSQRTRNHNPSSLWIIHENIPFYILHTDMGVYMLWLSKDT